MGCLIFASNNPNYWLCSELLKCAVKPITLPRAHCWISQYSLSVRRVKPIASILTFV